MSVCANIKLVGPVNKPTKLFKPAECHRFRKNDFLVGVLHSFFLDARMKEDDEQTNQNSTMSLYGVIFLMTSAIFIQCEKINSCGKNTIEK